MTSALLRAFSIWMPYKGTYPQWFAVPEWRRLQLLPLGQNKGDWRHLQTCIPFIVSPKEGWLSQLPKKDERGKKSGTRKKSFFLVYCIFPSYKTSLSGLTRAHLRSMSSGTDQLDTSVIQMCDACWWQPAATKLTLQQCCSKPKRRIFAWTGASSFGIKAMPWATAAYPVALLQSLTETQELAWLRRDNK